MSKIKLFQATALAGATLLVLGLGTTSDALAQTNTEVCRDAAGREVDCVDKKKSASAKSDESTITVVGSRIRRDQFNTADSIQLFTRDDAVQAGFSSTANLLQSTQVTGGTGQINNSFGGFVTNGGPGVNTLALRGIGPTRTLILLNGRRLSPSGTRGAVGAADLNALPNVIVDRIEVLNTGASSIYGSDAVAGVVNIVTRRKVDGFNIEGQLNVPDAGNGVERRISAMAGWARDRFTINAAFDYYNREAVAFGDRDFTGCQTQFRRSAAGAPNDSGSYVDPKTGQPKCYTIGTTGESGVTVNTIGTRNFAGSTVALAPGVPAGYTGACNRFRPNAAILTGSLPGYECVGGGSLSLNIRDTFPASLMNQDLISPATTYTAYLDSSYETDILGEAEFYFEGLFSRRKSSQTGQRQLTIDYPQGSPLLPTNLRNDTFLPAQAGGVTGTLPVAVRAFTDYGNYEARQSVDYVRALVGVRGKLDAILAGWQYDLSINRSWSDATYETDLVLTNRLAASLDVVQASNGTISCRNPLQGCVAAPSLSAATIGGQLPSAWIDFITEPVIGHTKYRETIIAAAIDGPLFSLWADPIRVALGFERRSYSIDDSPSNDSITNNTFGFTSSAPTRGSDRVTELFGEIEIPILKDLPGVDQLTLNGSGRYTHYKSYGSQWTYKFGGLYQPAKWLSFRGSYGTSFRAPALFEQYLGATSGFISSANDPCNDYTSLPVESVRRQNCAAEGLPPAFLATSAVQVNQRGGAESGLKSETSRSYTFGLIFRPDFGKFGSLSVSADYFNILVENGVALLGGAAIVGQCYDDPDFRRASICNNVTRASQAPYNLTVITGYVNISTTKVAGYDFNVLYTLPIGEGQLRLNGTATRFDDRYTQVLPTDEIDDNVGTLNNPKWAGALDVQYRLKEWTLRYGVEWTDAVNSPAGYLGLADAVRPTYVFEAPDYFLHTASVRWQGERFGILAGVRNLTNVRPPFISAGAYNRIGNAPLYSGYDYSGRTFFVNVSTKF